MRDSYHNILGIHGLLSGAKAKASSPFTGSALDLAGFGGALITIQAESLGAELNTYTFSLTESDGVAAYTAVLPGDLLGTEPVFTKSGTVDDSTKVKQFGYNGSKRYIKIICTVAGAGTGSGIVGATLNKCFPRHAPVV